MRKLSYWMPLVTMTTTEIVTINMNSATASIRKESEGLNAQRSIISATPAMIAEMDRAIRRENRFMKSLYRAVSLTRLSSTLPRSRVSILTS